jgi:AcrR family transcriptional regulator
VVAAFFEPTTTAACKKRTFVLLWFFVVEFRGPMKSATPTPRSKPVERRPLATRTAARRAPREEAHGATKGDATRKRILDHALQLAGRHGLMGLTIGELAADLQLSKSGLFAHFKSKERLQLDVLDAAAAHFAEHVLVPAIARPRGLERLRAMFENWLAWIHSNQPSSGCIFIAGAMEWDDREGPVRDALVHWFDELHRVMERAVRLCVEAGQLPADLDTSAFAYDMHGVAMKFHLDLRLMRSPVALERARSAFDRLLSRART